MLLLKTQTISGEIHVHLVNLSAAVQKFILGVLGTFADENGALMANELLAGNIALMANPATGDAYFMQLERKPTAHQIIAFVARFSKSDWDTVKNAPGFLSASRHDLDLASKIALKTLGYLPIETKIEINGE